MGATPDLPGNSYPAGRHQRRLSMHWYKRNIGDYAKKAGRLTMLQHGSYTLLLDACYDREQFPTLEQALEWTWAGTQDEIDAVKFVLSRFFKLGEDGRFTQDRVAEELEDFHGKSTKNRQIAIERETKRRENSTNRARIVNDSSPQEHEPPPNQEPVTSNQEPRTKEKSTSPAKLPTCPTQDLIDIYHEVLPSLPKCKLLPKKRADALRRTWAWVLTSTKPDKTRRAETADQAVGWFREYFTRAQENDFLMGKTPRSAEHAGWKCDMDYLLTDSGMKQVIEKTGAA
jgi:uncharacterized protein YdaU (DUF1376 family)